MIRFWRRLVFAERRAERKSASRRDEVAIGNFLVEHQQAEREKTKPTTWIAPIRDNTNI